jgi:hypothetical protein
MLIPDSPHRGRNFSLPNQNGTASRSDVNWIPFEKNQNKSKYEFMVLVLQSGTVKVLYKFKKDLWRDAKTGAWPQLFISKNFTRLLEVHDTHAVIWEMEEPLIEAIAKQGRAPVVKWTKLRHHI